MTNGRESDGNRKRSILLPMVIFISFTLVFQFPLLSIGAPTEQLDDTKGLVGGDFIISFDNDQTALHPSIAITPTNTHTKERGVSGWIHSVWDEFSEVTGVKEIHYSMSKDGGANWIGENEDIYISDPRQEKVSFGDAVNPSITVDSYGIIHVVWAEHYAADDTWEIHHSHSLDETGTKWSSVEFGDTLVSYRDLKNPNAQVMSPPKIVAGVVPGEVGDNMLHVTWSEFEQERKSQEVYYSSSSDGGNTWSSVEMGLNIPVSMPSEQGAGDAYDPTISTSGSSAEFVHISWTQKKVGVFETVYYLRSDDQGKTWIPEMEGTITPFIPERMLVSDLSMTSFGDDIHMVWSQMPEGKASDTGIFYSASSENGAQESWTSQKEEFIVSINNNVDGNMPLDPSIAVDDKQQVHVFWSEVDEKSPKGTQEIHTSFNSKPLYEPNGWTGQEGDIVLSFPDAEIIADVNNVSVAMNVLPDGSWRPRVVWDEINNVEPRSRAEQNNEIHTIPEWTLSVSTVGSGTVTENPNQETYTDGDTVTLTANPSVGWSFDHWSGNITGTTSPRTITMDWNKVITAYFVEDLYKDLTALSVSGPTSCTEGDSISISRTFQNIGTDASGTFRYGLYLSSDSTITTGDTLVYSYQHPGLAAGGSSTGSIPVDLPWGTTGTFYYGLLVDDLYQVVETNEGNNDIASASTVTITAAQFTLGTSVVGSGTVTKTPDLATYGYGDSVQLNANPSFGWEFDHWDGDLTGSTNPDSITMDSDKTVTAYFTQITHDIALTAGWNLVSIPLEQADTSIATVLSSISGNYYSVKYYDATDQDDPWKTYRVGATTNDLTDIDHTMAFWVDIIAPCTFSPTGEYASSTGINLYIGWNFVGYPSADTTTTLADALTGTSYDMIEGYDGGDPYLLRTMAGSEIMMPGAGYWVRVTANNVWTVDW